MLQTADFALPFRGARWVDVVPRSVACPGLNRETLLHAGPPLRGPVPAPLMNAAVQALLYEGAASSEAEARDALCRGDITLEPAQDHGVVTPLAQVVSSSMLLVTVEQQSHRRYAPLLEAAQPSLRFGSTSPECRDNLRALSDWTGAALLPAVRAALPAVDAVIQTALAHGDECHARTGIANDELIKQLRMPDESNSRLRANPAFVLSIIMASAAAALHVHGCSIAAIGGNGREFGVKRRGHAGWRTVPAAAPVGLHLDRTETRLPLPAIGDSAVIDFCGLGGQALIAAPLLASAWKDLLPADVLSRRHYMIDVASGIIDPALVMRSGVTPLINLGILDYGGTGMIGRGFYEPPSTLFAS